ncbi:MAG: putative peptidoglycan binding protein [Verrucomicrobiales bacterium]|nr:putative peptidoglycan binding protein [Verrucomicrobiales bacterium]
MKTKLNPNINRRLKSSALMLSALTATSVANASADYGPAIWRPLCEANWYTSGSGHKFHVVHDMEGYYASTVSWFSSCGMRSASVHYAANGNQDATSDAQPGEITQLGVTEANYAWHATCWNQHSTGTEHEGFANNPAWYTEPMYVASAGLTKHIADKFGYAKDRNHIVAHGQKSVPGWSAWASANLGIDPNCNTHTDPGPYWDWNHYMALINQTSSSSPNPSVVANSDGRLELFGVWSDNSAVHAWQTPPNGWSGWSGLAGGGITKIASARNLNGSLESFCIAGGTVFHTWPTPTGWVSWQSMGGGVTDIAIGANPDGHLEIFATGTDGGLWHNYQLQPNGATGWSGWLAIGGGGQTKIVVGKNANGSLEPFTISGNTLYHSWFNNGWVAPQSLGGAITDLSVGTWTDGRLEIFGVGTGGDMQHVFQLVANGSTGWSAWSSLGGGGITRVSAGRNLDGRLELFVIGGGGTPYHNYWTGSAWSGFSSLGGVIKSLTVGINSNGAQELFGVGTDNVMYHNYQTSPNAGWSGWFGMGGSFK